MEEGGGVGREMYEAVYEVRERLAGGGGGGAGGAGANGGAGGGAGGVGAKKEEQ